MSGAIPPLLQYAFMEWCLVKAQGHIIYKSFYYMLRIINMETVRSFEVTSEPILAYIIHRIVPLNFSVIDLQFLLASSYRLKHLKEGDVISSTRNMLFLLHFMTVV
jgi:hypothetical protein